MINVYSVIRGLGLILGSVLLGLLLSLLLVVILVCHHESGVIDQLNRLLSLEATYRLQPLLNHIPSHFSFSIGHFELLNGELICALLKFWLVRLSELVKWFGLYGLVFIAGFIDGILLRHIRRLQVAREFATKHHQLKQLSKLAFMLTVMLTMALPIFIGQLNLYLNLLCFIFLLSWQACVKTYRKYS